MIELSKITKEAIMFMFNYSMIYLWDLNFDISNTFQDGFFECHFPNPSLPPWLE
jgi:hypothetical protein